MTTSALSDAKGDGTHARGYREDFAAVRPGALTLTIRKSIGRLLRQPNSTAATGVVCRPRCPYHFDSPFDINALRDRNCLVVFGSGANPSNDGKVIRVVMPELTKERRQEYVKLSKSKAEDHRVSVRNSRRNAKETIDKMVDDGDIGKDEGHRAEKELDELTRKYVDQIDEMAKNKEDELLEV